MVANSGVLARYSIVEQQADMVAARATNGEVVLSASQNLLFISTGPLGKFELDGRLAELDITFLPRKMATRPIFANIIRSDIKISTTKGFPQYILARYVLKLMIDEGQARQIGVGK